MSSDVKNTISKMFDGMAISVDQGESSISIKENTSEGSVTISLSCGIPSWKVSETLTTSFSQTISVTLRSKIQQDENTPDAAKNLNPEKLLEAFKEAPERVGRSLGAIYEALFTSEAYLL